MRQSGWSGHDMDNGTHARLFVMSQASMEGVAITVEGACCNTLFPGLAAPMEVRPHDLNCGPLANKENNVQRFVSFSMPLEMFTKTKGRR